MPLIGHVHGRFHAYRRIIKSAPHPLQAAELLRQFLIVRDVAENRHNSIDEAMSPDDLLPILGELSNIKRGGAGIHLGNATMETISRLDSSATRA